MTIEIDGNKVTVFDKKGKKLDLKGIISMEIRATGGKPTEAIFTARPAHVTVKDVTRASIQELDR